MRADRAYLDTARTPFKSAGIPAQTVLLAELVAAAERPELDAPPAARAETFAAIVALGGDLR